MGRHGWYGGGYGRWAPYVSVAEKRANAKRMLPRLLRKGQQACPVECGGREIASSFWGKAWCDHMESFSDFSNRLPRGRTYVRNGSVCHLEISAGCVDAFVAGSSLYTVKIAISGLKPKQWKSIRGECKGGIGSLVELLSGRISSNVMRIVTDRDSGLFPKPGQMKFSCSCPDWASMCKHVSAVLYGVGARLDMQPDLLFRLRGVNPADLISVGDVAGVAAARPDANARRIDEGRIGEVFGIEVEETPSRRHAAGGSPGSAVRLGKGSSKSPAGKVAESGKEIGHGGRRPAGAKRTAAARARKSLDGAMRIAIAEDSAMAAFRRIAERGGLLDEELVIVDAADELGLVDSVCEREEEFRSLLSKALERGIFEAAGEGQVRAAARSLLDYSREELAGFMIEAIEADKALKRIGLFRRCAAMLGFAGAARNAAGHMASALVSALESGLLTRDGRGRIAQA